MGRTTLRLEGAKAGGDHENPRIDYYGQYSKFHLQCFPTKFWKIMIWGKLP